jgi:hypothetical protein
VAAGYTEHDNMVVTVRTMLFYGHQNEHTTRVSWVLREGEFAQRSRREPRVHDSSTRDCARQLGVDAIDQNDQIAIT